MKPIAGGIADAILDNIAALAYRARNMTEG